MKTMISYFSGTGNSLWMARKIAEKIPQSEVHAIAAEIGRELTFSDVDKIGIVFPLYFYGLPEIISRFIKQTDFSKVEYLFTAVTHGGPAIIEGGAVCKPEKVSL